MHDLFWDDGAAEKVPPLGEAQNRLKGEIALAK